MGGFRVNGCGTKDYFTKMKYLGERMCPRCKKMTPFYLEQAKYKISVFFIPTVTIKERYAIMCEKCKNGNYIEEAEMHRIMFGQDGGSLADDNKVTGKPLKSCSKCGAKGTGSFCGICGTKYEECKTDAHTDEKKIIEKPKKRICSKCGFEVSGTFCGLCGARYEEEEPADFTQDWECELCGTKNSGSKKTCSLCGCERLADI